ncbi:MAG: SH3 domain-containing protein [Anaerolineae bacterium]|nr:SH3 domain-containing protein [Anaerolineae bacterium]
MSKKPDKYTKIKTAEVSSQSWLGRPSEMDRTIEKWVNKGWTLTDRENIGTSKYLLTFEYSMSEAEIAKQKKSEQRTGWGCLIIIAVLIVSGVISANQNAASKATAQTQVALLNDTQAAESHATSTAKAISDTNATATATWWTSTPTVTPSNTSTSTNTPTATATPTNTSTPTITPTATDTFTPTTTETATNTPIATMTSTPMPTSVVASVTGNNINARRCPSQSCEVVRVVTSQEALVVLGEYDDWYWVKFPDNEAAYIFGDLVRLPEGAVVALAPTMTPTQHPSATPTATRTRRPTSTPKPTATPLQFDEELILELIRATMLVTRFDYDSINIRNGDLIVEAPAMVSGYDTELEYRMSFAGTVIGAVVTAYEGEDVVASPPRNIILDFKVGTMTVVRATFSYRDAVLFRNGDLTTLQFINRWRVE